MTNHPDLPGMFPVLALKISNPGKPLVLGKLGQLVTLFFKANIKVAGLG